MTIEHITRFAAFMVGAACALSILKVEGVISWPWLWVLVPIWGTAIAAVIILAVAFLMLMRARK